MLRKPGVRSVVFGARSVAQLDGNLPAATLRLSDAQLARMLAQMAPLTGLLQVQKKSKAPKLSGPAQELSSAAMARAMKTQKGEMR